MPPGIVVAAPASSAGKTTFTVGLIGALRRQGIKVAAAKCGPDYIDTQYLETASGRPAYNLDGWAMPDETLCAAAAAASCGECDALVVEGAMGVLDGAGMSGRGSTADVAAALAMPLVMVVDISRLAQTAMLAPVGLKQLRPSLELAGVVLNNVKSRRHLELACSGIRDAGIPLLGWMPSRPELSVGSRHLGLVAVADNAAASRTIDRIADQVAETVDLTAVQQVMSSRKTSHGRLESVAMRPPGQTIAIANDRAFSFKYWHMIDGWRQQGSSVEFFSPLGDEAPSRSADAVYLPGGYPELHASRLAAATRFRMGMHEASRRGCVVYGECGGYMALGRELQDASGKFHEMLGLLPHSTSFHEPKLHIGYRTLECTPNAPVAGSYFGHEHHHASVIGPKTGAGLFKAHDADGNCLGCIGHVSGSVCGSFAHIVCRRNEEHP